MKLENPLLRRAYLYLEDGEWGRADDYCEQVLDQEPENAQAYVIKLMARLKVDKIYKIGEVDSDYEQWNSYRNACRFADEELKKQLSAYLANVKEHIQEENRRRKAEQEAQRKAERERKQTAIYHEGLRYSKENAGAFELKKALEYFLEIQDFKDAKERAEDCKERIAAIERKRQLVEFQESEREKKKRRKNMLIVAAVLVCLVILGACVLNSLKNANEGRAKQISNNLVGATFSGSETDMVSSGARGESFSLVREMTEYSRSFSFHDDGTVRIVTKKFYDQEPFITKNGQRQWDSETEYIKTASWKDVGISITGKITVRIDGMRCEMTVNKNNVPISLIWNGTTYKAS